MWLLSTDRAELHYFSRSFDADGGYTILSHTWDEAGEQSFQDVRAIGEQCRARGTNPRDDPELSLKIRECCRLAERHGYRWVWIDSCCIDKTSSSELSEAINSMYKWYKSSEVCYAYLKDVPSDDILESPNSAFWNSRWHTRGWTLQELIAPDMVIFLSADWHELGSRLELSLLLHIITRLPVKLMAGATRPAQYSACIRMSWASQRKTTRIEDEAYCLMGLFGVSMPTNYGEGKRAFIRLQYEIMQHQESDMSLFAFGEVIEADKIIRNGLTFCKGEPIARGAHLQYLLADSPREFRDTFGYIPDLGSNAIQRYPPYLNSVDSTPFDCVELPHATVTSYGVELRLPVAVLDGITLAVILCETANRHFGLFLTQDDRAKDPKKRRYFIGCHYTKPNTGSRSYLARMCDLGEDLNKIIFDGKQVKAFWKTIYVVPTPSDLDSESTTSPNLLINRITGYRFQLPRSLVDRFINLQFEVHEEWYDNGKIQVVHFVHRPHGHIFTCLGACSRHHGPGEPPLWAKVVVTTFNDLEASTPNHDCLEDHLDSESWAKRSRTFRDAESLRMVRLSFTQSKRTLLATFIIHLELSGQIFQDLVSKGASISFPSPAESERDSPCTIPNTLFTRPKVRIPWTQPGSFDSDRDSPRRTPQASIQRWLHEPHNYLEKDINDTDPIHTASITRSQPRSASPQIESMPSSQIRPILRPQAEPILSTKNQPVLLPTIEPILSPQIEQIPSRLIEPIPPNRSFSWRWKPKNTLRAPFYQMLCLFLKRRPHTAPT